MSFSQGFSQPPQHGQPVAQQPGAPQLDSQSQPQPQPGAHLHPWLLKSPPSLFSYVSSLPDGAPLGTFTFVKKPAKEPAKDKSAPKSAAAKSRKAKKRKNAFVLAVSVPSEGGVRAAVGAS